MNVTLLKGLVALVPACILFSGSLVLFFRIKSMWSFLQLLGAGCLVAVVLAHICEALRLFPGMGWGLEHSVGHYLDFWSTVLGLTLFPVGYLFHALGKRRAESSRMKLNTHPTWYERHVLPYLIDIACGIKAVRRQRRKVVPLAHGRVLEIGIGTGLNLEHYNKTTIEKIVGLDPELKTHRLARKRVDRAGLPVELVALSAEHIPLEDNTFDTVLVTYSLCTISDPAAALKEMRRVLKPDGKLIFCEHGLAPDPSVRRWQDRLTPLWAKLAGGCHLNRDIPGLLREAGFRSSDMESMYLPGPRPLTYNYWGTAEAAREKEN